MRGPDGKFLYVDNGDAALPIFVIAAKPQIVIKLKRVFPKAMQDPRTGRLIITANNEVARDLEWFCDRHPLAPVDAESRARLEKMAAAHRDAEEAVARILGGELPDLGHREPAITPRGYQLVPRAMVLAQGFLLLGDDVGLGKTLSASLMFTDPDTMPALVAAPTHLVRQWEEELAKYYPWLRTHRIRQGTPYRTDTTGQRRLLDEANAAHVLLFHYHKLAGGWADYLQGKIRTVILDEAHELRTGAGTGKYVAAAMVAAGARYRIGCTATPVYNYGNEIHHVVEVLAPGALGSKDEFTKEWGGRHVRSPRALGQYLRDSGIMLRRTRAEVGRELPPVSAMVQPVETDHTKLPDDRAGHRGDGREGPRRRHRPRRAVPAVRPARHEGPPRDRRGEGPVRGRVRPDAAGT